MSEENKAVVRRVFDEIFNGRNHALVTELYAEKCIGCDPANDGDIEGHDALIALLDGYAAAFPGHRYDMQQIVAEGDLVAVRWAVSIPLGDAIPPLTTEGMSLCELRDGRITKVWQHWDNLNFLKQLGAVDEKINVATALAGLKS